jgi:MFS family permease
MILGAMIGIFMTIWYQFIDKGWFLLQLICVILAVFACIYYLILVPESPKWLYIDFQFDRARSALREVADFNGISDKELENLGKLTFDIEVLQKL